MLNLIGLLIQLLYAYLNILSSALFLEVLEPLPGGHFSGYISDFSTISLSFILYRIESSVFLAKHYE